MGTQYSNLIPVSIIPKIFRGYNISFIYILMHLEFEFLKKLFVSNGYYLSFIESLLLLFFCEKRVPCTCITNRKPANFIFFTAIFRIPIGENQNLCVFAFRKGFFHHVKFNIILVNTFPTAWIIFSRLKITFPSACASRVENSCARCTLQYIVGSIIHNHYMRITERARKIELIIKIIIIILLKQDYKIQLANNKIQMAWLTSWLVVG